MKQSEKRLLRVLLFLAVAFMVTSVTVFAEDTKDTGKKPSSYAPVNIKEDFASTMARMKAEKTGIMQRQLDLLNERYDLSDRPAQGVVMSRGKAVQEGVRIKLPNGITWEKLAAMSPEEIREKDLLPSGFFPLPFPNHPEGGMLFPKFQIDEIKKQEGRDRKSVV